MLFPLCSVCVGGGSGQKSADEGDTWRYPEAEQTLDSSVVYKSISKQILTIVFYMAL